MQIRHISVLWDNSLVDSQGQTTYLFATIHRATDFDTMVLEDLTKVAIEAAREAGEITLRYFNSQTLTIETKSDESPVTIADRAAEEAIVRIVRSKFPDHAILGEEYGDMAGSGRYRWIIDPIDGTKSFIHGVPLYGVLIGVEDLSSNDIICGVVNFPALGELYNATRGQGAFKNGKTCRVSRTDRLEDSILLTTDYRHVREHRNSAAFEAVHDRVKFVRTWGDCYGHMMVASGRAEVMMDPKMNLWDIAALKPIVEESGGRFFDWNGVTGLDLQDAVSTNDLLSEEIRTILQSP